MRLKPTKIILTGLNYTDHAEELGMPIPEEPIIFMKPATSVIGHMDKIVYPKNINRLDYEAELAVVIKKRCRSVRPEDAHKYIAGYTCLNDVTARDIQKKDGQWTRAKSFDTFCPIGPRVVKGIDPGNLEIRLFLNGELRQHSSTKKMIFSVEKLVSFVSDVMTLLPGDVIATGTPPGVGPMQVGDAVRVEIEKIGALENKVVSC